MKVYQPKSIKKAMVYKTLDSPQITPPVASIIINMQTLSQVSEQQLKAEEEELEHIANFIPFSATNPPLNTTSSCT